MPIWFILCSFKSEGLMLVLALKKRLCHSWTFCTIKLLRRSRAIEKDKTTKKIG